MDILVSDWNKEKIKYNSLPLIWVPLLQKKKWHFKRDGLSWGGQFSIIWLSQCICKSIFSEKLYRAYVFCICKIHRIKTKLSYSYLTWQEGWTWGGSDHKKGRLLYYCTMTTCSIYLKTNMIFDINKIITIKWLIYIYT